MEELKKTIIRITQNGGRLRVRRNPRYGLLDELFGREIKDAYFLTGIDDRGRLFSVAGSPEFLNRCLIDLNPEDVMSREAKKVNTPEGEGWQMWETGFGSSISPVFKTQEGLAKWLADTKASSCGDCTATYDEWLAMIKQGWAPSAIVDGKGLRSGVEAANDNSYPGVRR